MKIQENATPAGYAKFLDALPGLVPVGAELERIELNEKEGVLLAGFATSNQQINGLKDVLKEKRFIRRDPAVETVKEDDYWRFTMTMKLGKPE